MTPNPLGVLLADLAARDIELQAHGDRLRFRPRSRVTPDLAERLKMYKAQLLAILQSAGGFAAAAEAIVHRVRVGGDDDLAEALVEAWQERLSICTADGGLTLAEAEAVALEQLHGILDFRTSSRYT
jgi:hypothetical protein